MSEKKELRAAEAFDVLREALQRDEGYAWGWHCNIAMSAVDEGVDHETANRLANNFMQRCFYVDTKEPSGEQF